LISDPALKDALSDSLYTDADFGLVST
jgi:hypothetical protein